MSLPRILVVDDDESVRAVMCLLLDRSGFECVEAAHGREALAILQRTPVDVVVTDLVMPIMDGKALLRTMRDEGMTVPVIVVSGDVAGLPDAERQACQVSDALEKPVTPQSLVNAARRAASFAQSVRPPSTGMARNRVPRQRLSGGA